MEIGIVGATGAVGLTALALLQEGMLPVERVVPVASPRSAGRDLAAELDLSVPLERVVGFDTFDPRGLDAVVFCAGQDLSTNEGEKVAKTGALVVDNSSAFRRDPDVPLVAPEVNAHMLDERPPRNIVANPNCSTIQLVRALNPLRSLARIQQVVLSTYQAGSGGGLEGLQELRNDLQAILDGLPPSGGPSRFGQHLAFNVVPQIGGADELGISHEESKLAFEPKKILGDPDIRVTATAVRVPVFNCHSEAAYVRFDAPVTAAEARDALRDAPGVRLHEDDYPMPWSVGQSGPEQRLAHVGRVRNDPDDPCAVWLWIVADNLQVGAALNALEILQVVAGKAWFG